MQDATADTTADTSLDRTTDGPADAPPDAVPDVTAADADAQAVDADASDAGPPCVTDLSNVGTGDFHIAFTLTTLAGSVDMALVNQRTGCDETSTWWDVSYIPATSTQGAIQAGTDDGTQAHYVILEQVAGSTVDDGTSHRIVVARRQGMLSFSIDGTPAAGPIADPYAFGPMPPLKVGTDDCPGFGPTQGTIADVCITTP